MKKRLILILISIFSVFLLVFSLTGCTPSLGNQDAEKAEFITGTSPFETLKTFVTNFEDRTSEQQGVYNTTKTKAAAKWIAQQFKSFGYTTSYNRGEEDEGLDVFVYENTATNSMQTAYNVVYKKRGSSDKTVVIGANYDNAYSINFNGATLKADGTYNNGVGVATLIEMARVLQNVDLPFNIEFVAFGAKEQGWIGSQRYIDNRVDNDNIVLMINFDRNAIGDYVYMYSSEAKTKHNKFFYEIANEHNLCIADLPAYRAPSSYSIQYNSIYSNQANMADSQAFLVNGINVVSFISMNFSGGKAVERANGQNISYTKNDNFTYVVDMLGGEQNAKQLIEKQINSAVSAVYYALGNESFLDVMQNSKPNAGFDGFASSIVMYIASGALVVTAIVVCIILYFALKQTVKPHDVYVNTIYGRMNTKTGKIEQKTNIPQQPTSNGVGGIFGSEFESNQDGSSAAHIDDTSKSTNNDKTTDIFGDF